jgi:hypothetical protein
VETYTALKTGIPVIPVFIQGKGYDFKEMAQLYSSDHFSRDLELKNPASRKVLESNGFNVKDCGLVIREFVVDGQKSLDFYGQDPSNVLKAKVANIANAIVKKIQESLTNPPPQAEKELSVSFSFSPGIIPFDEGKTMPSIVPIDNMKNIPKTPRNNAKVVIFVMFILSLVLIGGVVGGVLGSATKAMSPTTLPPTTPPYLSNPTFFFQQGEKLMGSGYVGSHVYEGNSVSLSGDGDTAIFGGWYDNFFTGASWIFVRNTTTGTWSQQGEKLVANDATGMAYQGFSTAISGDGNTVLVGGFGDNAGVGAAWVFVRNSATKVWSQQGNKLVGEGYIYAPQVAPQQGGSVSLSGDASTAVIGATGDNSSVGAIWVFVRNSTGFYIQQGGKLVGNDYLGLSIYQGISTSISYDGNTVIFGGSGDNSNLGAAWIFIRNISSEIWSQQGSKLVGSGALGSYVSQGNSVAMSGDGNTAMIGGPLGDNENGGVWIFVRNATLGVWLQQGDQLVGSTDQESAFQGTSVSLSSDGNMAIVGGSGDNASLGATWIFMRNPTGNWSQQGEKLVGSGFIELNSVINPQNIGILQGCSVSMSNSGTSVIVGGSGDRGNLGAVWVFVQNVSTGTWYQLGSKLVGSGSVSSNTGEASSVSITADGNTACIGGPFDNFYIGATWLFTRNSNGTWSQLGTKLIGSGYSGVNVQQGYAVSISGDGSTVLSGGPSDGYGTGAVWVFAVNSTTGYWSQQGNKLVGGGFIGSLVYQGCSVALSYDGNTAIVGGFNDNNAIGAGWIFVRDLVMGNWSQQNSKLVGSGYVGTYIQQGYSVSISGDGNTVLIGGVSDDSNLGASWVFVRNTTNQTWSQQGNKLVGSGYELSPYYGIPFQGYSVSLSSDGNTAILGNFADNACTGAVWIFVRSAQDVWFQQGDKLVGTGFLYANIAAVRQGYSVSISGDGNTAIIGGLNDNLGIGAAWVFVRNTTNQTWSQQGSKLVGSGYTGQPLEGGSVAISSDGRTFISGGASDHDGVGAAWIFSNQ